MAYPELLVVKTGSTMPALARRLGDFEHWILRGMDWPVEAARVIDVAAGEPLPPPPSVGAVTVTGSHAMVSHRQPWSERSAGWLAEVVQRQVPVLGICFGHQLLAHALGGKVGDNPRGRQFGSVALRMDGLAAGDPLFGCFGPAAPAHVCHTQAVLELPPGARVLASCPRDPHHAFAVGPCAWGVQFHPEFSAEVVIAYIRENAALLREEGQDPDALVSEVVPRALGADFLRRFAGVVRGA